jgi:hypothetical protein
VATLDLVENELADACRWMQAESVRRGASAKFWFEAGHRDPAVQLRIWNERMTTTFLPGRPSSFYKGKRWYLKPGMALVAVPGTSDHEDDPATAVDIACNARDNGLRFELIREANCTTPVPGEPWHVKHRSGAAVPMTKKEVQMAEKDRPYISVPSPYGGFWRVKKADGGVGALAGAPYFGSLPGVNAKVVSPIVGLTPCLRGGRVIGYWLYDEAGHLYNFGEAPYFTSYADHPEWGGAERIIDGLVQTAGFEAGTQIRYCFTGYQVGDKEYVPDTYDIGREFAK